MNAALLLLDDLAYAVLPCAVIIAAGVLTMTMITSLRGAW